MLPVSSDTRRAWVDVDLDALTQNAHIYREKVGVQLLPMVKADGYGLGAVTVAKALSEIEPWGFGVATLEEAERLRVGGITVPLIVFTPLAAWDADRHSIAGVRPVIGDLDGLRAWLSTEAGPFHLEIDTGMNRSGFKWSDGESLEEAGRLLRETVLFEGAFTHFHSADIDPGSTAGQWARFESALTAIGRRPELLHAANSAAGLAGGDPMGDLARPGIHLYGGGTGALVPQPVAAVRARVTAVGVVERGESISYRASWRAERATTVATLGIGYGDGLPRSLSNRGVVELGGERVPIIGQITMDQMMVEIAGPPISIGDVATIFGGAVSLDEQAELAGTISYELLTSLTARLPRRYHRNR